jgi:hypothetical protein
MAAVDFAYTVCELLQGTWHIDELVDLIRKNYPRASADSIAAAADMIAGLHCSDMGYDIDDIEVALAVIVELPLTPGGVTIGQ